MSTVEEFRRRYEVQIASTIPSVMGKDLQGYWGSFSPSTTWKTREQQQNDFLKTTDGSE